MNQSKFSILLLLFSQLLFPDYLTSASIAQNAEIPVMNQTYIYEEFELVNGVEVADINFWQEWINGSYSRRRVIQLKEGANHGRIETVFFEPTDRKSVV